MHAVDDRVGRKYEKCTRGHGEKGDGGTKFREQKRFDKMTLESFFVKTVKPKSGKRDDGKKYACGFGGQGKTEDNSRTNRAEVGMPLSRAVKDQTASSPWYPICQGRDGASKRHASPR